MRILLLLTPLLLLPPAAAASDKGKLLKGGSGAAEVSTMLEKKSFTAADGESLPYRLLKPNSDAVAKVLSVAGRLLKGGAPPKVPLVVFLHGAGERGSDNEKQLVHGVAEFARTENALKYPCYLVAPQCPEGAQWVDVPWSGDRHTLPKEPSASARRVLELIDALVKEHNIDPQRIYLTGLSMGGYGVWDLLCRRPDFFAAAVPVCGGGDETQAEKIAHIPVWVFHGAKDGAVKPARSRNMVEALRKAGGTPGYTEYPHIGHDSWGPAYRDAEMMKWLFAQARK